MAVRERGGGRDGLPSTPTYSDTELVGINIRIMVVAPHAPALWTL